MKVLRRLSITSAALVSSTVAENDYAAWSGSTAYAIGARVIRTETHRIYERQVAGSGGAAPELDDAVWLDIGPTNRWAMFDGSPSASTSGGSSVGVVLAAGAVNDIILSGVIGSSVVVTVNGSTVRTVSVPAIVSPATSSTVTITGIGASASAQVGVTVSGSSVSVGSLLVGTLIDIGETLPGAQVGITDFSLATTNEWGVTTPVRRPYSRKISGSVRIASTDVDRVAAVLEDMRGAVTWWQFESGYDSLAVAGWVKDWSIDIQGATVTTYSISVEGLSRDDVTIKPEAGNLTAPAAISDAVATTAAGGALIRWTPAATAVGAEWRIGASWAAGTRIFRGSAESFVWLQSATGNYTLWGMQYSEAGDESAPSPLTVSITATGATSGGDNLVWAGYPDGGATTWNCPIIEIMPAGSVAWTHALQITTRDTLEIGNDFDVVAGEVLYASADITAWQATAPIAVGAMFRDRLGTIIGYVPGASVAAGSGWTPAAGPLAAPAGAVTGTPWLQYGVANGVTAPQAWASNIRISRAEAGATRGAPAGTLVGNTPAQTVESNAATALSGVIDINADDKWSPVEKAALVVQWSALDGARASITAQATAYGITTELTAYTTAMDALAAYLVSLVPGWNDTTQSTTIVRATADAKWTAAYTTRDQLADKIAAEAGKRATWTTVTGSGKPQDNATVGAVFGVNVGGQIVESTATTYVGANAFTESAGLSTVGTIPAGSSSATVSVNAAGGVSVIAIGGLVLGGDSSSSATRTTGRVALYIDGVRVGQSITLEGLIGSAVNTVGQWAIGWYGVKSGAVTAAIASERLSGSQIVDITNASTITMLANKR